VSSIEHSIRDGHLAATALEAAAIKYQRPNDSAKPSRTREQPLRPRTRRARRVLRFFVAKTTVCWPNCCHGNKKTKCARELRRESVIGPARSFAGRTSHAVLTKI
jgi:hypothetical protein